jgi:hypothetical protein
LEKEVRMAKRIVAATFAILVAWSALDYLLHGVILRRTYEATSALWRPTAGMNLVAIYVVIFVLIGCFVSAFTILVRPRTFTRGVTLGGILGLALGIASGFGTYIHMPIPLTLAWSWFVGGWIKGIVAGAIVGWLLSEPVAGEHSRPEA